MRTLFVAFILGFLLALMLPVFSDARALSSHPPTPTPPPPPPGGFLPADRPVSWSPGLMSVGGIPNRTSICGTVSPSGKEDSAAIQQLLNTCQPDQVILLSPGTFIVNNFLLIHNSITLRGSGPGATKLVKSNGAKPRTSTVVPGTNGILTPVDPDSYTNDVQPIIVVGPSRWSNGPDSSVSQNLTTDGAQGSYSVTVANASGFYAGEFVLLDETSGASWQPVPAGFDCASSRCPPFVWQGDKVSWNMHYPTQPGDDSRNSSASGPYDDRPGVLPAAMAWFSRTDRPTSEIKEIASISGNTITFTSPLTIGYRTSRQAQLTPFTLDPNSGRHAANNLDVHVTYAGVENLSMYGGSHGALLFATAAYSWAKSVEIAQMLGDGVGIYNSFRIELRDSYIHTGSWPEPGGAGYILSLASGSSEALIENNILLDDNKEMVFRSGGAGSVVAYNYTDDSWIYGITDWVETGLNASHMAGPHHVLFEGNYSQNIDSDYTHGNAIYLTFFRNWLSGKRRDFNDTRENAHTVGLAYGSWWDSFIGNVLGRPGQMTGWVYEDPSMTTSTSSWRAGDIWMLGYDPARWKMVPDPRTLSTVIRDGNYDYLTNSQHWHNTPGGFTIPPSMYLSSKPAFFGSYTWPWVDPATGTVYTLPAKARYEAGTPFAPAPGARQ